MDGWAFKARWEEVLMEAFQREASRREEASSSFCGRIPPPDLELLPTRTEKGLPEDTAERKKEKEVFFILQKTFKRG